MKKIMYLAAAMVLLAACQNKVPEQTPDVKPDFDILLINNGNWGASDASITGYNSLTGEVAPGLFRSVNNQALGDLAQDIIAYEDKLLIAMNGSELIYVTDRNLKVLTTIRYENYAPRYMVQGDGKIYVTYYNGFLGEIDPGDWSVRVTPVGVKPEGLAYVKGKIYVANSGEYTDGFDNTLSIVDAKTFKECGHIEVSLNPSKIFAFGNSLFVNCLGNYNDIPPVLQMVNLSDCSVKTLDIKSVNSIYLSGDRVYVLSGVYNEKWQLSGLVSVLDASNGEYEGEFASGIDNAYSITASGDYVFVGVSDYVSNGDMQIYRSGELVRTIDTEGLNPITAIVL